MILLLSSSSTPPFTVGDGPANLPIIGWQNKATSAWASSEAAGYPATNMINPSTFLKWKATSTAAQSIAFFGVSMTGTIDYVGIAKHNLGTVGADVELRGSFDGGFSYPVSIATFSPADDSPIIIAFTGAAYTAVVLLTGATSAPIQVGVVYVGQRLTIPCRLYVGHTPLKYARSPNVVTSRSENGNFLGRVVIGGKSSSKASFKNIKPDFYRASVDPFIKSADSTPFFFAWRPDSYPNEVGYAWLTDDAIPVNQRANGMMQFELNMTGII